jgi:predicted GNAT family acetyltransferase
MEKNKQITLHRSLPCAVCCCLWRSRRQRWAVPPGLTQGGWEMQCRTVNIVSSVWTRDWPPTSLWNHQALDRLANTVPKGHWWEHKHACTHTHTHKHTHTHARTHTHTQNKGQGSGKHLSDICIYSWKAQVLETVGACVWAKSGSFQIKSFKSQFE